MWVDSVKTGDTAKLRYLAECCQAAYNGVLADRIGTDAGELVRRVAPPLPPVWTWRKQDSLLLMIQGTTYGAEYVFQTDGWLNPVDVMGGLVNSYYAGVGEQAFLAAPLAVDLCFGHSMGGAAAQVAAARFRHSGRPACFAASFSSPRPYAVGHPEIAASDINLQMPKDPVPFLPYDGFGSINWSVSNDAYMSLPNGLSLLESRLASSVGFISYLLYTYGTKYHDIGVYVDYLRQTTPPGPTPIVRIRTMPVQVYQVKIKGSLMGQSCDNTLYLMPDGPGPAPAQAINDFVREWWQATVLPMVSNKYRVIYYSTRRIAGLVWKNPVDFTKGSLYRYDNHIRTGGKAVDYGRRLVDVLPSLLAVGFAKSADDYFLAETDDELPNSKQPHGGIRIGGIVRENINVATNELETAAVTSWSAVGEQLVMPKNATDTFFMALVTNTNGGVYLEPSHTWLPTYIRKPDDDTLPWYAVAKVNALSLNPFVTSQVSRKQTIANQG